MNKFFIISIFLIHFGGVSWAQEIIIPISEMSLQAVECALEECDVALRALQEEKIERLEKHNTTLLKKLYAESTRILRRNKVKIPKLNKRLARLLVQVEEHNDTQIMKQLESLEQKLDVYTEENKTIVSLFPELEKILKETCRI